MDENIIIREAVSETEIHKIEELQRKIFGFSEREILGAVGLFAFKHNGSILLLAIDSNTNKVIGFVFSFVALHNNQLCYHCALLGVLPEYRLMGVGLGLMLEQKKYASMHNIELITWYIDPLDSICSYLSIRKLGGFARRYYRNFYGSNPGHISAGLDTDRLLVEWNLKSDKEDINLSHFQDHHRPIVSNKTIINSTHKIGIFREITDCRLNLHTDVVFVEIPENIQLMISKNLDYACKWRIEIRNVLENYLSMNYIITGFDLDLEQEKRCFYILSNKLQRL